MRSIASRSVIPDTHRRREQQHLRGGKVTLYYQVLRPDLLWLEEGGVRVPVREVDATGNSRRPRVFKQEPQKAPMPTGLNAIEDSLQRLLHPSPSEVAKDTGDEFEGGVSCVR